RGSWISEALLTGVRAILPRDAKIEEIVAAIGALSAGLVVLSPATAEMLATNVGALYEPGAVDEALTPREVEVLSMLAEGIGNKLIANRLSISEHTVKFHISSIFGKLSATSRTEAVMLGIRRGLIML